MPQAARTEKAHGTAQGPIAGQGEAALKAPMSADESAALPGVLAVGLDVVREQLQQNLRLQQAMMSVVSSYCLAPRGDDPAQGGPPLPPDLLAALQTDDLLRQRQEGVERALAVLQQVISEMGQPPSAKDPLDRRQHWIDALLESQFLEDMRSNFAAAFVPQA